MLLWAFLPVIGVYKSSLLFQAPFLGVMAIWIISGLSLMSRNSRNKCLFFFLPFLTIMYMYAFIGFGNLNIPTSFDYALLFGFVVNSIYYLEKPDTHFDKITIRLSLLLLLLTAATTISVLSIDGSASRILTSSSSDPQLANAYKHLNVGAFDYIYGLVVILPMLAFYLFTTKSKWKKLLLAVVLVLFVLVIVMSNFTTALLLLFVDFVFIFLSGKRFKSNASFAISFILLVFVASFILTYFINFMIQIADSVYAQSKLEGILGILHGQENYSETTSRSNLVKLSIDSFIKSPIWGVGAWYGTGSGAIYVGQHAQFIDDLARYGLLGFIPLFSFLIMGLKRIYKAKLEMHFYNRKVLGSILVFIALGFLNPIYISGFLASMFIVVPTLDRLCYLQNENTLYN